MWKKFVIVVLFFPVFTQCNEIDEINFTCAQDTYSENENTFGPPSENMCMAKCVMERLEILDKEGNINKEVLTELMKKLPEEKKKVFVACAEKVSPISECKDIETVYQCIQATLNYE